MKIRAIPGCLLLAGFLLAAHPAAGEESPPEGTMLEFQVENDFNISSLDGATFAWRLPTGPDRAWRIGIAPRISHEKFGEIDRPYDRRTENDSYALELDVMRLRYRPLQGRTRGYWGFGPGVSIRYSERRDIRSDSTTTALATQKTINRRNRLGFSAVVGVEYVVSHDLSLTAEYGADLVMTWTNDSYSDETRRVFEVRGRGARLGLSLRF